MNLQDVFEYIKKVPKRFYFPLVLGILGIVLVGYGLIQLLGSSQNRENSPQALPAGRQAQVESAQTVPTVDTSIQVDVEGAVVKPGVYSISQNSRIQDGLISAGGLSLGADRGWVAKNLNLASHLTDGAKIYIPKIGEILTQSSESLTASSNPLNTNSSTSILGLININTASETDLDSLPGVGPVTAQKIINGRPYTDINDLQTKKIVSAKVFEEIKDKISVN